MSVSKSRTLKRTSTKGQKTITNYFKNSKYILLEEKIKLLSTNLDAEKSKNSFLENIMKQKNEEYINIQMLCNNKLQEKEQELHFIKIQLAKYQTKHLNAANENVVLRQEIELSKTVATEDECSICCEPVSILFNTVKMLSVVPHLTICLVR